VLWLDNRSYPRNQLRLDAQEKLPETEISLEAMVYNLKRMLRVLGGTRLRVALAS
jgi:hypothetical protein